MSRGTRAISTARRRADPTTDSLDQGFGLAGADCKRQGTANSPPSTVHGTGYSVYGVVVPVGAVVTAFVVDGSGATVAVVVTGGVVVTAGVDVTAGVLVTPGVVVMPGVVVIGGTPGIVVALVGAVGVVVAVVVLLSPSSFVSSSARRTPTMIARTPAAMTPPPGPLPRSAVPHVGQNGASRDTCHPQTGHGRVSGRPCGSRSGG